MLVTGLLGIYNPEEHVVRLAPEACPDGGCLGPRCALNQVVLRAVGTCCVYVCVDPI